MALTMLRLYQLFLTLSSAVGLLLAQEFTSEERGNIRNIICRRLGLGVHTDPFDCRRYHHCLYGEEEQSYAFRCYSGFVYHPNLKRCVLGDKCIARITTTSLERENSVGSDSRRRLKPESTTESPSRESHERSEARHESSNLGSIEQVRNQQPVRSVAARPTESPLPQPVQRNVNSRFQAEPTTTLQTYIVRVVFSHKDRNGAGSGSSRKNEFDEPPPTPSLQNVAGTYPNATIIQGSGETGEWRSEGSAGSNFNSVSHGTGGGHSEQDNVFLTRRENQNRPETENNARTITPRTTVVTSVPLPDGSRSVQSGGNSAVISSVVNDTSSLSSSEIINPGDPSPTEQLLRFLNGSAGGGGSSEEMDALTRALTSSNETTAARFGNLAESSGTSWSAVSSSRSKEWSRSSAGSEEISAGFGSEEELKEGIFHRGPFPLTSNTKTTHSNEVESINETLEGSIDHCNTTVVCSCPLMPEKDYLPADFCQHLHCRNGGMHITLSSGHCGCVCPLGYRGHDCGNMVEYSKCRCANGGRCVSLPNNTFACQCPLGFIGGHCQHKIDQIDTRLQALIQLPEQGGFPLRELIRSINVDLDRYLLCSVNTCLNGGICFVDLRLRETRCFCTDDHRGKFCEKKCENCVAGGAAGEEEKR